MYTSAMLKAEFSDGSGQWLHHFSENIFLPILASPTPVNASDIVIVSLLRPYFQTGAGIDTYLDQARARGGISPAPSNPLTVMPPDSITMGSFMSSSTNVSHNDTVSMFCFTESILKNLFVEQYKVMGSEVPQIDELIAQIMASPIENIPQIMNNFYTQSGEPIENAPTLKIIKNPTLTITRCFLADFAVVSDQYRDVPPFVDAFDLIKERVTRQESYLNGTGYAPAVYTDNGGDGSNDTIVFTGEYAMTTSFPTVSEPPLILT